MSPHGQHIERGIAESNLFGAVRGPRPGRTALGNAIVDRFGQSGHIPDLYRAYRIDTDAILDAAASTCLTKLRQAGMSADRLSGQAVEPGRSLPIAN
jgi:pyruvate dehydrogenase complex dehydrogenase (E1) component